MGRRPTLLTALVLNAVLACSALAGDRGGDLPSWRASESRDAIIEFMRVFAEETYGIPPHQVIGSSIKTAYKLVDGVPSLVRAGSSQSRCSRAPNVSPVTVITSAWI
jgi:hypothetical protein